VVPSTAAAQHYTVPRLEPACLTSPLGWEAVCEPG